MKKTIAFLMVASCMVSFLASITHADMAADNRIPTTSPNPFYQLRGNLDNSRTKFTKQKNARVAYLGGSITKMTGWRDLTCQILQSRFPDTKFDFLNAGIGGTDSILGAIRFQADVLKNGPVDLLFLEFAVNDGDENPRSEKAMEGIIRHARRSNPNMDIIILYFAEQKKTDTINQGKTPIVITKHDTIARHYQIPSVNLAAEVARRLNQNQFTWDQFSKDSCHPLPFGHQIYAECIDQFLTAAWKAPVCENAKCNPHPLPEPLDPNNYEHGQFIDLDQATHISGWTHIENWDTQERKVNYRGPVDVLTAETPGAELKLDFQGPLIGIYAIAGMDAGTLECTVDNGNPYTVDLFDNYCEQFHRPVHHILAENLTPKKHAITLKIAQTKNQKSTGHAARIMKFTINHSTQQTH